MSRPQLILVQQYVRPETLEYPMRTDYFTAEWDEPAGQLLVSWWNNAFRNGGGTSVVALTLKQAVEEAYNGLENWYRDIVGVRN